MRSLINSLLLTLCAFVAFAADQDRKPDGKGARARTNPAASASVASGPNGISYHGGPLMLGTTNVYYIFYGNWTNNSATTILPDLAARIGGSPYFNINTTYTDQAGRAVANAVNYAGSTTDSYSRGTSLADADIRTIVTTAINSGRLGPIDPNGVYFVLTSADVQETSGFCTSYCGWHTYAPINGYSIKYSFIGNGDRCPSACQYQSNSPNGNAGADGMASVIVHELEEAVTDPLLNAWYDAAGYENADKCAWTYGAVSTAANGSLYNMTLGSRQFLIQRNWVNASGGYCALSWAPAPVPPTADSVTPNSGSGAAGSFKFQYSSASGYAYLSDVYALFNGSLNGVGACLVLYDKPSNAFYLYNDAATGITGPLAPGAAATLSNSQCSLNGVGSTIAGSGNALTMTLNLGFNASFGGTQQIFMYSADGGGLNSGWQSRGTWSVPASNTPPTVDSVSPSSGSALSQTFTFKSSSANGYLYLSDVYMLFNGSISAAAGCLVLYDKPTNGFYLYNDAGSGATGPLAPNAAGSLSNSQCALSGTGSSVSGSGSTLTTTLNLTFNASFAGPKNIYMYSNDRAGQASGWQTRGTWTVP